MKRSEGSAIAACVGAVIGAGFASGQEIVTFFSRYGVHSWWLIALCAAMMGGLCLLCMHMAGKCTQTQSWCDIFEPNGHGARLCTILLMIVTAGAMVAAAGQITALVWPSNWAYALGSVGTLLLAWKLGFRSLGLFGRMGGVLAVLLLAANAAVLIWVPAEAAASIALPTSGGKLLQAVVAAVAYAAMNMTLAIGMVCRCGQTSGGSAKRISIGFGISMAGLLAVSNAAYVRHPYTAAGTFPMVALMARLGGYFASAALLYLAILSTLTSVLYAFRSAVECKVSSKELAAAVVLGLPLLLSFAGFDSIVQRGYAPAGMACLLMVFAPLVLKMFR